MKETNGKVLEVFIGECFMFRADDLLAPDLMEAHERYGIYIDDAFFTVQFFGGNGKEEEKQVIVYTGFLGENMHLQFLKPLSKEITQDNVVDFITHVLGYGADGGNYWFEEAIKERVSKIRTMEKTN